MKKIFYGLLMAGFIISVSTLPATECKAQIVDLQQKTITAADTINFKNVASKVKSFTYNLIENSGTTAGKVYLEGSNIAGSWDLLDSLVLADVGTLQKKTVLITATSYANYRWRNTNTSSSNCNVKGSMLRRPDE